MSETRPRVVVVDDDPLVRAGLRMMLGGPDGVPSTPRQAGLAVIVERRQDQAAQQAEVLQEVSALLGAVGGILELPVRMPGERGRHERCGERGCSESLGWRQHR